MKTKINTIKAGSYEISVYDDGTKSCNCKSWIYHKSPKTCKHIQQIEISITELKKPQLTAEQEDYLLEQAREDYFKEKYEDEAIQEQLEAYREKHQYDKE